MRCHNHMILSEILACVTKLLWFRYCLLFRRVVTAICDWLYQQSRCYNLQHVTKLCCCQPKISLLLGSTCMVHHKFQLWNKTGTFIFTFIPTEAKHQLNNWSTELRQPRQKNKMWQYMLFQTALWPSHFALVYLKVDSILVSSIRDLADTVLPPGTYVGRSFLYWGIKMVNQHLHTEHEVSFTVVQGAFFCKIITISSNY